MTTVNMDLDGVLCDFNTAMLGCLPQTTQLSVGPYWQPTTWDWWEEVGMSGSEWNGYFYRAVREHGLWEHARPYDGVAHEMWRLHDAGVYVRIVTTRLVHTGLHREAVTQTVRWLENHNIPYRSLAFEEDKAVFSVYDDDWLLDDNITNMQRFNYRDGVGRLLSQPWNRSMTEVNAFRVSSLREFVDEVVAAECD